MSRRAPASISSLKAFTNVIDEAIIAFEEAQAQQIQTEAKFQNQKSQNETALNEAVAQELLATTGLAAQTPIATAFTTATETSSPGDGSIVSGTIQIEASASCPDGAEKARSDRATFARFVVKPISWLTLPLREA